MREIFNGEIKFDHGEDTGFYVPNHKVIRDSVYPKNINGTCGFTAACIVLDYWNKTRGGYIPDKFLEGGNLKTTGFTLQDQLRQYSRYNKSWAKTITDAINSLCRAYNLPGKAYYTLGSIGVKEYIQKGRPAIVFGWLNSGVDIKSIDSKPLRHIFHAVTVYGREKKNYITHYGWKGYEKVLLKKSVIGSVTLFNPDVKM